MDTMRRLYLLRHAKSSWDDPSLADRERPLAKRGRKACKRIAAYLRERQIEPSVVIPQVCAAPALTAAKRTRTSTGTVSLAAPTFAATNPVPRPRPCTIPCGETVTMSGG